MLISRSPSDRRAREHIARPKSRNSTSSSRTCHQLLKLPQAALYKFIETSLRTSSAKSWHDAVSTVYLKHKQRWVQCIPGHAWRGELGPQRQASPSCTTSRPCEPHHLTSCRMASTRESQEDCPQVAEADGSDKTCAGSRCNKGIGPSVTWR